MTNCFVLSNAMLSPFAIQIFIWETESVPEIATEYRSDKMLNNNRSLCAIIKSAFRNNFQLCDYGMHMLFGELVYTIHAGIQSLLHTQTSHELRTANEWKRSRRTVVPHSSAQATTQNVHNIVGSFAFWSSRLCAMCHHIDDSSPTRPTAFHP